MNNSYFATEKNGGNVRHDGKTEAVEQRGSWTAE